MEDRRLHRDISARILLKLAERGISPYRLLKDCGIPEVSFYRMMNGERNWRVEYVAKIAEYFSISLDYLINGPRLDEHGLHLKTPREEALESENYRLREELAILKAIFGGASRVIEKRRDEDNLNISPAEAEKILREELRIIEKKKAEADRAIKHARQVEKRSKSKSIRGAKKS